MTQSELIVSSLMAEVDQGREGKSQGFSIGLPKFEEYVDGVTRGTYTLLFAESGVGKSSFMLYSYIYRPLMDHLDDDNFKISLFSLEMHANKVLAKLLSTYLFETYGVRLTLKQILSVKKGYRLDDENYRLIQQSIPWMLKVMTKLTIYDKTANAKSIYAALMKEMEKEGTFSEDEKRKIFIPNNPALVHLVVIDHISRVQPQTGHTLKEEIDLTSKYLFTLKNMCGISPLVIAQSNRTIQSMERRKQNMVLPLSSDIKDSNSPYEDCELCIAIFSPKRSHMATHNKYDINKMGDTFRSLVLLKGRYGESDIEDAVYYDGECNKWVELPRADEIYDYDTYTDPRWYLQKQDLKQTKDEDVRNNDHVKFVFK